MSRGTTRIAGGALATLGAALAVAVPASAAPVVDGEFDVPGGVGSNNEIVQGPDGNMWVTRENDNGVARITPDGAVTPFPTSNTAYGITVGPDNNLWVTTGIGATKIDPATGTQLGAYNLGFVVQGAGITTGPDGNLWAVAGDELVSFSPADPEGTVVDTTISGMNGKGLETATDGLLWIADQNGRVISATAENVPDTTDYDVQINNAMGGAQDVAIGPDGQVAYVAPTTDPQSVGRLTAGGSPLRTELEASDPFGIEFGEDGAYWIARAGTNDLLRLTPDGQTSNLTGFTPPPAGTLGPRKIATGPGNTLWVTLDGLESVARVTGVGPETGASLETTIDKAPKKKLKTARKKAKAKFKFSSSDPAATFECKLKRKGKNPQFKACASPRKYKLKPGKYKFQVRAVAGGVVDPTPAKFGFKVVRKPA